MSALVTLPVGPSWWTEHTPREGYYTFAIENTMGTCNLKIIKTVKLNYAASEQDQYKTF